MPTPGLCIRAIAGHTAVLDPTRHLPLMRHDEAIRRSIALHCTTWVSADGLLPNALIKRTHIHLTTYPLNTQGFVEARGHRPYALHSGHYSLIHNFQALAGRQGLTGGCAEYKCPRCMARFATKASWQRHRATQCYREIAERTLPGPRRACCATGARPPQSSRPSRATRRPPRRSTWRSSSRCAGFFLLRRCRALRLRATRGAEAEAHAPRAGHHAVRTILNDLLKLADHYLTWRTRKEELEHRAATHCRECLASFETAEKKLQALGSISGRCATPATSRPRRPRPSQWSFTTGAATTSTSCCATSPRWALLSAGRRAKSLVRRATTTAPRAMRKEASRRGPCPWPRLHQSQWGRRSCCPRTSAGPAHLQALLARLGGRGGCSCPA